jgi:hypothetical protein
VVAIEGSAFSTRIDEILRQAEAPDEVRATADELGVLQMVTGVAWASMIAPAPSPEVPIWGLEFLKRAGLGPEDPAVDTVLWLLGSTQAAAGASGDLLGHAWIPKQGPVGGSPASYPGMGLEIRLLESCLAALESSSDPVRFRGLALAAILGSRTGLKGLRPEEWVGNPWPAHSVGQGWPHSRLLDAGQVSVATGVFRALQGHLAGTDSLPFFHDALGQAGVPLAWVAYALSMRSGSPPGSGGMDEFNLPPSEERRIQGWAGPRLTPARRFARRAVLAWPSGAESWDEMRAYDLASLDPIGSGWIHQELALNLRGLVDWAIQAG